MDNLDRMYRHLVRTIRSRFPQYINQPLDVAELHQTVLPYRHHRRELGLETNEDYEITLTELLSGARGYLIVDERMGDVLRAELASANPDPSAFKQFASASVALAPGAIRGLEIGPDEDPASAAPLNLTAERRASGFPLTVPRGSGTPGQSSAPIAPVAAPSATPMSQPAIALRSIIPQAGERCPACNEELPPGRAMTYCPHCGQNVTTVNCPACGSELEVGWKFCPTCGRRAAE